MSFAAASLFHWARVIATLRTGQGSAVWERCSRIPRWICVAALLCAALGIAVAALSDSRYLGAFFAGPLNEASLPPLAPSLHEARAHLTRGDFLQAERIAQSLLAENPRDSEVLLLAGEAATRQGRPEESLNYYSQIPADREEDYITGLWSAGSVLVHLGRLSDSEPKFREVLQLDPKNQVAHRNLAFLLCATGRRYESLPHLLALLKLGVPTLEDLLFLGNPVHTVDHSEFLTAARQAAPNDPLPTLGLASVAMFHGKKEEARELLKHTLAYGTPLPDAQALLGRYLVETDDAEGMREWNAELTPELEWHPEIWFVRGVWAQDHGETGSAIRCYWETLLRHPDHARANYRLGQLLVAEGRSDWAQVFSQRAEKQEELNRLLHPLYSEGPEPARMARAAKLTEELGRPWEAWAWYRMVADNFPGHTDADAASEKLLAVLRNNPPRSNAYPDEGMRRALAAYPLPSGVLVKADPTPPREPSVTATNVKFAELSDHLGLQFQYFNSDDPKEPGTPIYHQLGGGIGNIDFDRDGWVDFYLSQGARWPVKDESGEFQDKLFQSRGGEALVDVTERAGLGDKRYSQGVAVGDFDNDGFADIYVANIGGNRLYHNRGDGTFSELIGEFSSCPDWTTSCVIADITGDGNPDLFDVNYLEGRQPFELKCRGGKSCSPNNFIGQQDQLYVSQGDGTFRRATEEAGLVAYDGKGLGALVADFDGSGRLAIFVANDTTANHFFVPQSARGAPALNMADQALLAGLAFDRDGLAQACMGIGFDDADNDGLWDLFVTNFYNESNSLYRQVSSNLFSDDTRAAELRTPSLTKLGFGTQFLDADLDGNPDLIVTNGHVDDYRDTGAAYKMPPQFFRNRGRGVFDELPAAELGEYFRGEYLGRALAKTDFNRDGRPDFVVLHLDAPLALLANETRTSNHFLALHLAGRTCDRDAIGARVTIETDAGTRHKQLTAGDGYQVSNERMIHAGLGHAEVIRRLKIRWPHGARQEFAEVPADRQWLAIEGRAELVEVPR